MAYIKFADSEEFILAAVVPTGWHVVRITPKDVKAPPDLGGFRLYLTDSTEHPMDSGEYEGYTTLYREGEGWYELSDDGSVYREPEDVAPVQPTDEELEEQARRDRIYGLQTQVQELKKELSATDYQVIKAYEYSLVGEDAGYDMEELHGQRQAIRDQINEIEGQIEEL